MNKPRKQKKATQSRCALAGGSIPVSSANALIADWQQNGRDCMKMSRQMDGLGREDDRYRWFRVAQTFRFCAKELRRQMALSNKRQPESNAKVSHAAQIPHE